jgi:hypothetical protein
MMRTARDSVALTGTGSSRAGWTALTGRPGHGPGVRRNSDGGFRTRPFTAFARALQVIRPVGSVGRRARIRALRSARSSDAIAASFAPTLGPPRMVVTIRVFLRLDCLRNVRNTWSYKEIAAIVGIPLGP